MPGDLADARALARLVAGADLVIHNAGVVRARNAAAFMEANATGARRMAEAAARSMADDGRYVLVSSLAAVRPGISSYAASKAAAEDLTRKALAGRPIAIARPPAVYGPDDAATQPLFDAIRRGLVPMLGPASARFAMIYVDDAARAILAAGRGAAVDGPTFEFDDGASGHSWADLRAAAEAAAGRPMRTLKVPAPAIRALGALGSLAAWTGIATPLLARGKAREILAGDWLADPARRPPDWSPEVSLASGFSQTLAWYRERRR